MKSMRANNILETSRRNESGSIIFLIFIGVMLFAALSFTVGQMLRTGNPEEISGEKVKLFAAELLEHSRQLKEAVQTARISGICDDTDISFANALLPGYEHTPVVPAGCRIFHASEGVVNYRAPSEDWLDALQSARPAYQEWILNGSGCVDEMGSSDSDCDTTSAESDSDLLAIVPWVNRQICVEINDRLSVENPGGDPPQAGASSLADMFTKFTGFFAQSYAIQGDGSDPAILTAVPAGCFEGGGTPPSGTYHFYQVLISR